ncbi:MAG: excinuclease ABC subunit UvrC [Candidatus Limiplasma sp.]|nr:excinuclease ABC subunit UvrC [Candidatus Limiplasma sp.]
MNPTLAYKIKMLPESPGCYIMKSRGEIIYVGKAVNLKNRVRQYFHGSHTPKVAAMVSRVDDFDLMLCQTNFEALTLECNLIKKHRPFYNILLKDDKHYPYLRIDLSEPFPRLTLARNMDDQRAGVKYFGPYIGATAVRQVMDEVRRFFPLRTCNLSFPVKSPRRPCVHHQIGQCLAPCAGGVSEEEYRAILMRVIDFLNGDSRELLGELTREMNVASARMEYEQAAVLRDKIADIRQLMEEQHAIQTRDVEQDVLAVAQDDQDAMVQLTHIRAGRIEGGRAFLMEHCGAEAPEEVLAGFLTQYYDDGHLIPRNVLAQALPEPLDELERWLRERRGGAVTLAVPQRGDKVDLVRLALKNAEDALSKHRQSAEVKDMRTRQAMLELKEALHLPALPRRIEGYDISNTQGILSVASMVVFQDGLPDKKAYRIYRIKTVEGANDFASMAEVITRRFTHGLRERHEREQAGLDPDAGSFSKLPDVILIDGGPEQLLFAHRAMQEAGASVPMFGLAKRFEEIYLPGREEPIVLDRRSNALHLVQHVRDEAHRFGITHHRALRGKEGLKSELSAIPGVGPKKQAALIRHFRSVKAIFEATKEELCQVEGISAGLAQRILDYAAQRSKAGPQLPK